MVCSSRSELARVSSDLFLHILDFSKSPFIYTPLLALLAPVGAFFFRSIPDASSVHVAVTFFRLRLTFAATFKAASLPLLTLHADPPSKLPLSTAGTKKSPLPQLPSEVRGGSLAPTTPPPRPSSAINSLSFISLSSPA